jgi:hypothetical protein
VEGHPRDESYEVLLKKAVSLDPPPLKAVGLRTIQKSNQKLHLRIGLSTREAVATDFLYDHL